MAGLVRQQERSVARERTLTGAGAALVAATSRDEIARAALDAIVSLVGSDAESLLCLVEDDGLHVVAARTGTTSDVAGRTLLPATAGALLGAAADTRRARSRSPRERRADLGLGGDDRHAVVLGLSVRARRAACSSSAARTPTPAPPAAACARSPPRSPSRSRARR